jgi:hypothetical protein
MNLNGRKVAKKLTEQRILEAMPEGHRLIRINWKKGGKIHVADGFGRVTVISLPTE